MILAIAHVGITIGCFSCEYDSEIVYFPPLIITPPEEWIHTMINVIVLIVLTLIIISLAMIIVVQIRNFSQKNKLKKLKNIANTNSLSTTLVEKSFSRREES